MPSLGWGLSRVTANNTRVSSQEYLKPCYAKLAAIVSGTPVALCLEFLKNPNAICSTKFYLNKLKNKTDKTQQNEMEGADNTFFGIHQLFNFIKMRALFCFAWLETVQVFPLYLVGKKVAVGRQKCIRICLAWGMQ